MAKYKVIDASASMRLLPAKAGTCPECATVHDPALPHNLQSLFYGVKFKMEQKRDPTWKDALAHCTEEMQGQWLEGLKVQLAKHNLPPICHLCGSPAVCLGKYDNMTQEEHACDECCGHGNEDGYCSQLPGTPTTYGAAAELVEAVRTKAPRAKKKRGR